MAIRVDARTVKAWLSDTREIAFLDVREHGQFGEGHPLLAIPAPYSRFEAELVRLVPNFAVRLVLLDDGDGVADRAARSAEALGYRNVHALEGGAEGWRRAGYTLFRGVNVPSKVFGELLEHQRHTPRITAQELQQLEASGAKFVIVDGRPFSEYQRMNIPSGVCCPNGELALRIDEIAPDPAMQIVVNCAGRTRSIIGAETLIAAGVPNKVVALENGTQGWFLAGLELERGAARRHAAAVPEGTHIESRAARVHKLAQARGVRFVTAAEVEAWLRETDRTTYLLDVRTPEEFATGSAPGFQHAPGGQLVQATDQWVGVIRARIVLADSDGIRAPMMAQWLAQLGHDVAVLDGGIAAGMALPLPTGRPAWRPTKLAPVTPKEAATAQAGGGLAIVDVRASLEYRKAHVTSSTWAIRPRLDRILGQITGKRVALVADQDDVASLAAQELTDLGCSDVRKIEGGLGAWSAATLPTVATPGSPADAECIDYLFFVHDRHDGNAEAARGYIAWEQGLIDQLDDAERAIFKIAP